MTLFDEQLPIWERRTKGDRTAIRLANRHYSRLKYGRQGKQVGPPGRLLVYVTPAADAVWVSHWPRPDLALDHLDAYRCVLFRNEGPTLSSTLITAAMAATEQTWGPPPRDGWITFVDRDEIRSTNPGYCFQRAGWTVDWQWQAATKTRRSLTRLYYGSKRPTQPDKHDPQ